MWPFRRSAPRLGDEQARAGRMFVAPALIHLAIFTIFPVIFAFVLSFTNYATTNPDTKFVLFRNYENILSDEVFWTALRNTLIYALMSVPFRMAFALVLAVLLNQVIPFRGFFRAAVYMPQVTSIAAISIVWLWLYNPQFGLINQMLKAIGLPAQTWLQNPQLALPALVIMTTWYGIGANMVIFLAGLQGIPDHLYEAARIDGAGVLQIFRYITVPQLAATTTFVLLTNTMEAFRVFESIYLMTNGGPGYASTTLTLVIYKRAFENFQMAQASSLAFLLFIVVIAVTALNRFITQRAGGGEYDQ